MLTVPVMWCVASPQVASIAKRMVTEWGMSEKLGPILVGEPSGGGGPFMGRSMGQQRTQWAAETMLLADEEVNRLVNQAYVNCKKILTNNRELLETLASSLMEQETVSAEEFQLMIAEKGKYMQPYDIYGDAEEGALPFDTMPEDAEVLRYKAA